MDITTPVADPDLIAELIAILTMILELIAAGLL